MSTIDQVKAAVYAALEKKAKRLVVLDVAEHTDLCNYVFVCSGENNRQTKAICDSILTTLKNDCGERVLKSEGEKTGNWILLDYGDFVVHIFFDYLRDYYAIEGLWPEATFLDTKSLAEDYAPKHH